MKPPDIDRKKLAAARLWAASRYPYLASALFASRIISIPGTNAIAVDADWNLYFDPEVVDRLTVANLGTMMVHHSGHLLRDHATRARTAGVTTETSQAWTTAADAEINDDFEGADLDFPSEPVTPPALGLQAGRFAEEYYAHLKEDDHACEDCGSGVDDSKRPWDSEGGISKRSAHLVRCQVASDILQHGKQAGVVPLGMQRWAEKILRPRVDWRRALAAEIRSGVASVAGKVDYTYRRPSRRQSISKDIVMPSLHRPIPEIAVVIDTSGSMSESLLGAALAEVEGLLKRIGLSKRLSVLSCDAAARKVQKVSSVSQVQLFGGGGTNMGQGIDAASLLRPLPSVVVILTDGFTPWPDAPPKNMRVVVGLLEAGSVPPPAWAKTIRIDRIQ